MITLLLEDEQMVIKNTEDDLKKTLYQLFKIIDKFQMKIFNDENKVMTLIFSEKDAGRV
jgi:hypothetical protein